MVLSLGMARKFLAAGQTYTRDELKAQTEQEVADLPAETWRDGVFNFDDYLTESLAFRHHGRRKGPAGVVHGR
jgi:hypothetical protein